MDSKIIDFLKNHRVCVLSVLLPDGSPHAATMHYSHQDTPLKLFFSTTNTSRKCQNLKNGRPVKASGVIGFSEEEGITLQMDGKTQIVSDAEELKKIKAVHYAKHPTAKKHEDYPETVFLAFTPSWWRYTDFTTKPPTVLSVK